MENKFNSAETLLRIEEIYHIGSMIADEESWAESLIRALEHDAESIFDAMQLSTVGLGDTTEFQDEILRANKTGWLIKVSSPVPKFFEDGSFEFSWGYIQLKFIYADSFDDCVKKSHEWNSRFLSSK